MEFENKQEVAKKTLGEDVVEQNEERDRKLRNEYLQRNSVKEEEGLCAAEPNCYQYRMITEYRELKERYNKLHKMIVRYEAGTLEFKPNCSLDILKKQASVMGEYLFILEIRAEIEKINL